MTSRFGRVLDVAIGVLLVALAAVGALRWLDVTWPPVVIAQTAGPFVVVAVSLLFVVTLLLRRWWMLLPVAVVVAAAWFVALPSFFASGARDETVDLTVMSSNLRYGQANPEQLMDAVRFHSVDVLIVLEATPDAVSRLDDAGSSEFFRSRVGEARPGTPDGTLIYSRYPLTTVSETGDREAEATTSLQPEVTVNVGGKPLLLKAVHPRAPVDGSTQQWRDGLRALQVWKEQQPAGQPLLIAGDFNAGEGHPGFRAVADGLDEAHRTAGLGWVRTWPVVGRRLPAYVQIDHLLSRDLLVVDAGTVALHGTDHAAVWAQYAVR